MNFIPGLQFNKLGEAEILLWAPCVQQVDLLVPGRNLKLPLIKAEPAHWQLRTSQLKPGDLYLFLIDSKLELPDPASRKQADGISGPSSATDLSIFKWTDTVWKNLPLEKYIIYKLDTRTFTPEGNLKGIEARLDQLESLGITAVELMSLTQYDEHQGKACDSIFPFAVQYSYGGPEALMHLVNSCHRRQIAVILDLQFTRTEIERYPFTSLGPLLTDRYKVPGAPNFDGAWSDGIRNFYLQNVLMWFRDFHLDAVKFNAADSLYDLSPVHILKAIRTSVNELSQELFRPHYLFTDSDLNDTRQINSLSGDGFSMDAQYNNDFHHALMVCAGRRRSGIYADFNGLDDLAKSYTDAFVYDGRYSTFRNKTVGSKTMNNPGKQFIVSSQSFKWTDKEQSSSDIPAGSQPGFEMQKLIAAAVLISPYLPLIFMGEECYITVPSDKQADFGKSHFMYAYYQQLVRLRKQLPAIYILNRKQLIVHTSTEQGTLVLQRWHGDKKEQTVCCLLNFSAEERLVRLPRAHTWVKILDSAAEEWGGPGESDLHDGKMVIVHAESVLIFLNQD